MKRAPKRTRRVRPNTPLWQYGQARKRRSGRVRWIRSFPVRLIFILLGVFLAYEILTLPFLGVAQLSSRNPGQTALMEQRKAEANDNGTILRIDHRWVPLSQIPEHVRMAVLVAEDGAFFSHAGVDWYEVREALEDNLQEGRIVRGGSTITQQLAKNLYLSTSKDPIRKFKELLITWMLENSLTKKRILELYLNVIEWGPGVFGVEAAAQRYFHKPASQLTLNEGVRLAAVIPRPLRHRPTDDNNYVRKKTQWIFKRMPDR